MDPRARVTRSPALWLAVASLLVLGCAAAPSASSTSHPPEHPTPTAPSPVAAPAIVIQPIGPDGKPFLARFPTARTWVGTPGRSLQTVSAPDRCGGELVEIVGPPPSDAYTTFLAYSIPVRSYTGAELADELRHAKQLAVTAAAELQGAWRVANHEAGSVDPRDPRSDEAWERQAAVEARQITATRWLVELLARTPIPSDLNGDPTAAQQFCDGAVARLVKQLDAANEDANRCQKRAPHLDPAIRAACAPW